MTRDTVGTTFTVKIAWVLGGITAALCVSLTRSAYGQPSVESLGIEVACDATSFVFQGPSTAAGPDYGASFVVQGVIYRQGTFAEHGANSGLLANGDPEFPQLVIGRWTCKGWFLGDGIATASGPFVVTTQIYELGTHPSSSTTLVSEGFELIDLNVPLRRAVTGGTGRYRGAEGQVAQTSVGVNETGLFNFTFDFEVH